MLKYIGEFKKQKSKYSVLNIGSASQIIFRARPHITVGDL